MDFCHGTPDWRCSIIVDYSEHGQVRRLPPGDSHKKPPKRSTSSGTTQGRNDFLGPPPFALKPTLSVPGVIGWGRAASFLALVALPPHS